MRAPQGETKLTVKLVKYCIWCAQLQLGVVMDHDQWLQERGAREPDPRKYLDRIYQRYTIRRPIYGPRLANGRKQREERGRPYLISYKDLVSYIKDYHLTKGFDELELGVMLGVLLDSKQLYPGPVEGTYWLGRKFPRWFE